MTTPPAFNFGATERSDNYWAQALDPKVQAQRAAEKQAKEAEQRRMIQEHQEAQRRAAILAQSGPAIVDIVKSFDAYERPTPAKTSDVQARFSEQFPDAHPAEFRRVLDELKGMGVIREVTSSIGFMGQRDTHLHYMGE